MAGDWIKMRKSLINDGRVVRMMSALQADRFRTIGGLMSAWCLLDEQTEDGGLDGYTRQAFDEFVGFPGLASAMIAVGWLEETPQGLAAPNFTEHNGATAKRRAQDSVRKMSARKADICPQKLGQKPEQEKRREEKSTHKQKEVIGEKASFDFLDNQEFAECWGLYLNTRTAIHGKPAESTIETWFYELSRFTVSEASEILRLSTSAEAKRPITNGSNNRSNYIYSDPKQKGRQTMSLDIPLTDGSGT